MSLKNVSCVLGALLALVGTGAISQAALIAAQTSGTATSNGTTQAGQPVTTPSGGSGWNNLVFNFYSNASPATTAEAAGTIYLLTQTYTGTPNNLSSSTPGFVASVAAASNLYTFAPSVTVLPSSTYYFYQSGVGTSQLQSYSVTGSSFQASSGTSSYASLTQTYNYSFSGTAVPEPASVGWIGIGGLALLARRRRTLA